MKLSLVKGVVICVALFITVTLLVHNDLLPFEAHDKASPDRATLRPG